MGGKRRPAAGAPRLLRRYDTEAGRAFCRAWRALRAEHGQFEPETLIWLEAGRVALAWSNLELATRALDDARQRRAEGKGRRPSTRELERHSRRQGLADSSYAAALAALRELVQQNGHGLGEALAELHRG